MSDHADIAREVNRPWEESGVSDEKMHDDLPNGMKAIDPRETDGCHCTLCGAAYKMDLLVRDELWKKVAKPGDENGLLCPTCIVQRLEVAEGFSAFRLSRVDSVWDEAVQVERRAIRDEIEGWVDGSTYLQGTDDEWLDAAEALKEIRSWFAKGGRFEIEGGDDV